MTCQGWVRGEGGVTCQGWVRGKGGVTCQGWVRGEGGVTCQGWVRGDLEDTSKGGHEWVSCHLKVGLDSVTEGWVRNEFQEVGGTHKKNMAFTLQCSPPWERANNYNQKQQKLYTHLSWCWLKVKQEVKYKPSLITNHCL